MCNVTPPHSPHRIFNTDSEGIDDLASSFNNQLLSEVEIQENIEEEINIYDSNEIEEENLEPDTDIDCDLAQKQT